MLGETQRVPQAEGEPLLEHRIGGDECVHFLRAERDDFRVGPGGGLAQSREYVLALLLAFLVDADAAVLVGLQRRVGIQPRCALVGVGLGFERRAHRGRAPAQRPLLRLEHRDGLEQRLPFGLPRRVTGINVSEVPRRRRARGLRDRDLRHSRRKRGRDRRRHHHFATRQCKHG